MSKDKAEHYAFARGYYDARALGNEQNPYTDEQGDLRQLYRDGYDWGIRDYCNEHHADEVNS